MLLLQTADAGMLHHHLTITFGVIWAAWNLGHLFAFQHYKHLTPARSIRASRHFRHTPLWKLQDLLLHCHDIVVSEQQFIKLHCSSVPIYRSIAMLLICCHYCFVVVINLHRASRGPGYLTQFCCCLFLSGCCCCLVLYLCCLLLLMSPCLGLPSFYYIQVYWTKYF